MADTSLADMDFPPLLPFTCFPPSASRNLRRSAPTTGRAVLRRAVSRAVSVFAPIARFRDFEALLTRHGMPLWLERGRFLGKAG